MLFNFKAILKQKSSDGDIAIPDLKSYHRAMVAMTTRDWNKNRHGDKQKCIEDSETNSESYHCLLIHQINHAGKRRSTHG